MWCTCIHCIMSGSGREQPDADFDLSCGVDHLVACRRPTVLSALSLVRVHGSPFTDYHSTFIVVRRRNRCCRHSFHSSSFGRSVVRSFGRSVVRSFGRSVVRRSSFVVRRSSFVVRCSSFVVRTTSRPQRRRRRRRMYGIVHFLYTYRTRQFFNVW